MPTELADVQGASGVRHIWYGISSIQFRTRGKAKIWYDTVCRAPPRSRRQGGRYTLHGRQEDPQIWNAGSHSTEAGSHTPRWQESDSDSSNNQARLQLGRGTPTRALVTRRWQLQSTERVRLLDSYVLFPTREPNSDTGGAAWNIAGCNLTLRYDYMQIGALIAHTTPKIA